MREAVDHTHRGCLTCFADRTRDEHRCSHDRLTLYLTGLVRTMIKSIVPFVVEVVYIPGPMTNGAAPLNAT